MAIKVIAQRREVKLGKNPGKKFVMRPDLYIPIQEKKVFSEASLFSINRDGEAYDEAATIGTGSTDHVLHQHILLVQNQPLFGSCRQNCCRLILS